MTVEAPETVEVKNLEVRCDGGSYPVNQDAPERADPLGHPTVYLKIGSEGWVECPYCDRKFLLKEGATNRQN